MLAQELLSLSEENPLGPARAAGLALACPGACGFLPASAPFSCADGRAHGRLLGADALEGPWVCAIGAFDGFHAGHQALIERARSEAAGLGARVCAVTFSPDPAEVLGAPEPSSRLVDPDLRPSLLLGGGADAVAVFDFDGEFAGLAYDEFVRDALLRLMDVRTVVVGLDFRMGAGGAGTVEAMRSLGLELGFSVVGLDLVDEGGMPVTATRVRGLVRGGRVEDAAGLMGRCHSVRGRVGHGRGEGGSFGFPTANVLTSPLNCVPEQGVYACLVTIAGAGVPMAYPAAVNVGAPPSFDQGQGDGSPSLLEANLIGFSGDLYGSEVCVAFVRWLRDSVRFGSLEELRRTVLSNISWVRDCLGSEGVPLCREGAER